MFRRSIGLSPRELGKCFAYALILLAPGSFVVLPLLWLVRQFAIQTSIGGLRRPMHQVIGAARDAAAQKASPGG
jgi:hypothetical protein